MTMEGTIRTERLSCHKSMFAMVWYAKLAQVGPKYGYIKEFIIPCHNTHIMYINMHFLS